MWGKNNHSSTIMQRSLKMIEVQFSAVNKVKKMNWKIPAVLRGLFFNGVLFSLSLLFECDCSGVGSGKRLIWVLIKFIPLHKIRCVSVGNLFHSRAHCADTQQISFYFNGKTAIQWINELFYQSEIHFPFELYDSNISLCASGDAFYFHFIYLFLLFNVASK